MIYKLNSPLKRQRWGAWGWVTLDLVIIIAYLATIEFQIGGLK